MADELDALLQLAEEAGVAGDAGTAAAPGHGSTAAPVDDDPLLSLADAVCPSSVPSRAVPAAQTQPCRTQTPAPNSTQPRLCSTKAFTAATPGGASSSRGSGNCRGGGAAADDGRQLASASGTPRQQQHHHEVQHYVEKLTGLKIKLPRVSGIVLKERYRSVTVVPVSKAAQHNAPEGSSWVVVGVLVSKQVSTTSKGAPYSRWRVSDLAGCDAHIALFGEAHKDHYSEAEGGVLAFYNPRFSSKGPGGSSSSSGGLAVSQSAQVELLATSAGWGFCRGTTKAGARCSSAVDTTVSHYCQYHALQQAKTLKVPVKASAGGKQQQQQQSSASDAPPLPAASNGKLFDARSKTWSTVSCPRPPAAAAASAPSSRHASSGSSSSQLGSNSSSSSRHPAGITAGALLGGSGSGSSSRAALPARHGVLGSSSGGSGSSRAALSARNEALGSNGGSGGSSGSRPCPAEQLAGSSTAAQQQGHSKAASSEQQAEIRAALKAKLCQQQQQQQGQGSCSTAGGKLRSPAGAAGSRQPRPSSRGGFSLSAAMKVVSRGLLPAEQEEGRRMGERTEHMPERQRHQQQEQQRQWQQGQQQGQHQQQQQQQQRQHQQQQQQHQQQQQQHQQQQEQQEQQLEDGWQVAQQPAGGLHSDIATQQDHTQQHTAQQQQQQHKAQHQPARPEQQQQQQQQRGLDDLMQELFGDDDEQEAAAVIVDNEHNDLDDSDDLVIEPAAAVAASRAAHTAELPQQQDHIMQHALQEFPAAPAPAGSNKAAGPLDSAAARGAAAMARLCSTTGPGSSGSSASGTTATKQLEARKRMKEALGLSRSKSSSSGGGSGSGSVKKGTAGVKQGAAAAKRPHVSRIGAVAGTAAAAAAVRGAAVSSVVSGAVAAAAAAGGGGAAGPGSSSGAGGGTAAAVGSSQPQRGVSAGGASGFRAMFGRVLQRTDINVPDAKLLGAVSDAAHASMMTKLLDQYEQKDNLAQQLEGITKLEVTAFECRTCKFLTEKRRATCVRHDIVAVRVTKRWWICEACGWRLHTLRELMPSKRCPKCRDPEKLFRPTSAYTAPKPALVNPDAAGNPIACREAMLPRGQEHAKFLNSMQE